MQPVPRVSGWAVEERAVCEKCSRTLRVSFPNNEYLTERKLADIFKSCGCETVVNVQLMVDKDSGRSKGFGFVEMDSCEQATIAINTLHRKIADEGWFLTVTQNETCKHQDVLPSSRSHNLNTEKMERRFYY